MKLVEKPLPITAKTNKYKRILAEFDESSMKSAKVSLGLDDPNPQSVCNMLRRIVRSYPEYSYIGISFVKGEVYLYRKE